MWGAVCSHTQFFEAITFTRHPDILLVGVFLGSAAGKTANHC
jgi:hypothetical protein